MTRLEKIISRNPQLEAITLVISSNGEDEKLALLRTKEMPEFAFLIWKEKRTSTYSQITIKNKNNGNEEETIDEKEKRERNTFSVACVCCPETSGIKPDVIERLKESEGEEEVKKYKLSQRYTFAKNMENICKRNGISTVFVRRAHEWGRLDYPQINVWVIEADDHIHEYRRIYEDEKIIKGLNFISHSRRYGSSGLVDPRYTGRLREIAEAMVSDDR